MAPLWFYYYIEIISNKHIETCLLLDWNVIVTQFWIYPSTKIMYMTNHVLIQPADQLAMSFSSISTIFDCFNCLLVQCLAFSIIYFTTSLSLYSLHFIVANMESLSKSQQEVEPNQPDIHHCKRYPKLNWPHCCCKLRPITPRDGELLIQAVENSIWCVPWRYFDAS